MSRKADGSPNTIASSKRSFCGECSSMLWLHDDEWAKVLFGPLFSSSSAHHTASQWIYPFASSIDKPDPLPAIPSDGSAKLLAIMRGSCPSHVPLPENAEAHEKYGPGEGIEVGPCCMLRGMEEGGADRGGLAGVAPGARRVGGLRGWGGVCSMYDPRTRIFTHVTSQR